MTADAVTMITIAGMVVVTYAAKAGGLWALGWIDLSPRVRAGLEVIPAAVLISLITPALVTGGPVEWAAAAATLVVAWRTDNLLLAMVVGVGAVWFLRSL